MSEDKSPDVFEDAADDEDEDLSPEEMKETGGGYNHNSLVGMITDHLTKGSSKDSDQTGGATDTW